MKAIIFDLDGVVADTSEGHFRSWQRLADEEGLAFDRIRYRALLGRTREDSLDLLLDGAARSREQRREMLARKQGYFEVELAAMGPGDALPGVVRLLDAARDAGLRIGLASSSRNARAVLARLELLDRFDVISDGDSVVRPKPAPDIFLWTAAALGVDPADCVVLEDAEAGIEAAAAAGCQVVGIGPDPIAARHLTSLEDGDVIAMFATPRPRP